jgi:hypothetical protein
MGHIVGPAMPQSLLYRTLYTLMAMTLAYLVVTLTVSKCCYRCGPTLPTTPRFPPCCRYFWGARAH